MVNSHTWPPPAQSIAAEFDRRAGSYDESEMHRWVATRTVAEVDIKLDGALILDAAAGTALAARVLLARAPSSRALALDLSPQLLRVARQSPRVAVVQGDVAAVPVVSGVVDIVVCVSAAAYFRDADPGLAEFNRVLRPGGQLVLHSWAQDGLLLPLAFREAAMSVGVELTDPNAQLGSVDRLRAALDAASFHEVRIVADTWRAPWPDPSDAWTGLISGITGSPLNGLTTDEISAARRRFIDLVEESSARHELDEQRFFIARAHRG